MTVSIGLGEILSLVVGWVGLGQSADGFGWVGSQKWTHGQLWSGLWTKVDTWGGHYTTLLHYIITV